MGISMINNEFLTNFAPDYIPAKIYNLLGGKVYVLNSSAPNKVTN